MDWPPRTRDSREFRSEDILDGPFGWNLLNVDTNAALMSALEGRDGITLRFGTGFADMLTRDRESIVRLSDGTRLSAQLVVAMDGRNSAVRTAAGIDVDVIRYGQTALAFTVQHPLPHGNVSTEFYNEGGPFTMVPLPDVDGQPASAIVWMNPSAKAQNLSSLPGEELSDIASQRACNMFGPLRIISPIRHWPIAAQKARALTAPRTASLPRQPMWCPRSGRRGSTRRSMILRRSSRRWRAQPIPARPPYWPPITKHAPQISADAYRRLIFSTGLRALAFPACNTCVCPA